MIKNVFIPGHVGSYYLFSKRLVGFDVGRTHVHATVIHLYHRNITIEKSLEEKIELGPPSTYAERAEQAIKRILEKVGKYDEIHTAFNSTTVVFKELTLPFLDRDKIAMILNFEIEPLLPFPVTNAITDFIITKQYPEENRSDILVAAVLKEQVAQHLQLFDQVGVDPAVVTIDLFALYGLYTQVPEYAQQTGNVALIDFGVHATRIAFIVDKQLKYMRVINKGLLHIAKHLSDELNTQPAETMEQMVRFGMENIEDEKYTDAMTRIMTTFCSDIDFTLRSFAQQSGSVNPISILLLGRSAEIKNIYPFIHTLLSASCTLFDISSLLHSGHVVAKNIHVARSQFISLSTVFPAPITDGFNLRQQEFSQSQMGLFKKQIITAIVLMLMIIGVLGVTMYLQLHRWNNEIEMAQDEAIEELKEYLPQTQGEQLDTALESAQSAYSLEEQAISFISPTRPSYLLYLLELTTRIDKGSLGFIPEKITFENNTMALKARVKDYDKLKLFEKALRDSRYFEFSPIDKPDFDIRIRLKGTEGS